MYPTHNEEKPIVAERFIRTLKNKIYRQMTAHAKNAKFKIGDHVRISNYKDIFAKGYAPNWSAEDFCD